MQFYNENYETRRSKLADKDAKCWIAFERREIQYGLQPLAARFHELASEMERQGCCHWSYSEHRREYQSKLSTDQSPSEQWYEIVWGLFRREMTGAVVTKLKWCLSIFVQNKCLIINRDRSVGLFYACFTFKVKFLPFITAFARLRICLFRNLLCRDLAKFAILVQFLHYCC